MPAFSDTPDFLSRSALLRRHGHTRTLFDPENQEHRDSLKHFIVTGNWGPVQFYTEHPYTDVPMTTLMKLAGYYLGVTRQTPEKAELVPPLEEAGFLG